jgi:hypothetical protein
MHFGKKILAPKRFIRLANYLVTDHCVEHMRQYIMCAGDLTPIPTKFFPSVNHSYVDPERPHTCRNFQKVRDWVLERTSADV